MKKLFILTALVSIVFFSACTKEDDSPNTGSGSIPTAGWQIGTTNYSTFFTQRNAGLNNSIMFADKIPGLNDVSTVIVLFNNISGIAAGTYKIVVKSDQTALLADEIMVSPNTGYTQSTGSYNKSYVSVLGQTITATVTITGGKAKLVVPSHNIISFPINTSSTTTTFAGTLVEK